nr:aminoglycoside phosphotransferase family protein [Brachybacterium sacelli]
MTVTGALPAGAGLPVLEVLQGGAGGRSRRAVLKLDGAGAGVDQQARILEAAEGHGYVRLLDHDPARGAMLLERLGPTLAETTPDPVAQTDVLAGLLEQAWELPLEVGASFAPDQKARSLLELVEAAPDQVASSRHGAVLSRARELALSLAASPAPRQVVVHGDPHASNALAREGAQVLIDPDGFRCEPEYDAGVVLRDHQQWIDDLERAEGAGAGRRWHTELVGRLARRLELEPERIAAWAHLERVTTGIHLGRLGYAEESEAWLRTAARVLT